MNPGAVAVSGASFGEGSGRIWSRTIQCTGNERYLRNCTTSSVGNDTCTHAQDAGVRCQLGKHYDSLDCWAPPDLLLLSDYLHNSIGQRIKDIYYA